MRFKFNEWMLAALFFVFYIAWAALRGRQLWPVIVMLGVSVALVIVIVIKTVAWGIKFNEWMLATLVFVFSIACIALTGQQLWPVNVVSVASVALLLVIFIKTVAWGVKRGRW